MTDELNHEIKAGSAYRNVLRYWEESSGEPDLVELLMKQDNMSMAASIESRVPFLDHALVEWATRVPASIQIRGTAGKRIVKKATEGLLPHSIIYRPKLGFPDFQHLGAAGGRALS